MLKWIATILFICAGLMLALNIESSRFGFLMFFTGHIILLACFARERDWAMVTQNGFFIGIDIIGIYRWFF